MSELNSALTFLEDSAKIEVEKNKIIYEKEINSINLNTAPFDIQKFGEELAIKSGIKNKQRADRPNQNITGYDIAHNCIGQVIFKLRNTPIKNYVDAWLPIYMRTELGNAVHNFIQTNTKQFTEVELNLKVPSVGFYGKIDYTIGDNIIGEIKSCTYSDYATIIRKQAPRTKDYLQIMTYQYILETYLDEIQQDDVIIHNGMGDKPKLKNYDIKQLQFIYVAHDMVSSNAESYAAMVELAKSVKTSLNSKRNPFFFITTLIIDLTDEIKENCHKWISEKINDVHHYMKTDTFPKKTARYVDHNGCYFCPYKYVCKIGK